MNTPCPGPDWIVDPRSPPKSVPTPRHDGLKCDGCGAKTATESKYGPLCYFCWLDDDTHDYPPAW